MPIYEYACAECGHQLEALQKISEEPLTECPECGKPALTKLVSAAGFRLKGGGWYETDFKAGNQRNLAKGESSKAGSGGSTKSSDSKPASSGNGAKGGTKGKKAS